MASVRQLTTPNREGKRPWVVEYTDAAGKRRRATPPSGLKKDADKLRQKIEREIEDGGHVAASDSVEWSAAVDAWLRDCDRRWKLKDRMAGNTIRKYESRGRLHVIGLFPGRKVSAITHRDLQDAINTLAPNYARSTLVGIAVVMKQTLKFAQDRGWIAVSPTATRAIRIPRPPADRPAIPSKQEIRAILDAAMVRRRGEYCQAHMVRAAMIVLAVFAGLRRGEIFGLQWENVDFDKRLLNIKHSQSQWDGLKCPKTRAGVRTIPMAEPVAAVLDRLRALAGPTPSGYVLLSVRGKSMTPSMCFKLYQPVMKAAGLVDEQGTPRYTFHSLRHANVSLLIDQGLDAFRIKSLVGHGSINVTLDIYGHLFPDDGSQRKAIDSAAMALVDGQAEPVFLPAKPHARRPVTTALPAPTRQERDMTI